MRTAPLALAGLGDDERLVELAMSVSALTHADPVADEACALWCVQMQCAITKSAPPSPARRRQADPGAAAGAGGTGGLGRGETQPPASTRLHTSIVGCRGRQPETHLGAFSVIVIAAEF
jgi:hypothetical protein